jgi:hypothetical protein
VGELRLSAKKPLHKYLSRQVKHQYRQIEYPQAGNDEIDNVEQRLSPNRDVEIDVRVGLWAARVGLDMALGLNVQNVPFDIQVVLGQVYAIHNRVVARHGIDVHNVHLYNDKICCRVHF